MKAYYARAGVPSARWHLVTDIEAGRQFIKEVGYPVIVKPDDGMGAAATWKLHNDEELQEFYRKDLPTQYIMEEFVVGTIVSFDGIVDQDNNIIFETSHTFPLAIMDIVNDETECYYWSEREIPAQLKQRGSAVVHAFDIRGRFFHTEYFRLTEDKAGLGRKGDYVGLEVNMRPPGGFTLDMMNFANDIDVYQIYADMAMHNKAEYHTERPYCCVYAARRDGLNYIRSEAEIYAKYGSAIRMHRRNPGIIADAMGNEFYVACVQDSPQAEEFIRFVLEKA